MTGRSWLILLAALSLSVHGPRAAAGEEPPPPPAGIRSAEARAGAIVLDRGRVDRAVKALTDAWFVIEREGNPLGYHRIRVRRDPDGGFQVSDDLVMASPVGKLVLRSEVTTGPDILGPIRASCRTFQGSEESPVLRGGMEFGREKIDLTVELFADGEGARLSSPRRTSGAEKRLPGPILIQSLVPLLLSTLPAAEDGAGLGKLVLIELPADNVHLAAFKRDRRISIETTQGRGRRVMVHSSKEHAEAATLRFGEEGEITRIEMPDLSERRTGEDEVRRAVPQAFQARYMLDVISIGSMCMDMFLPPHPPPAPGGLSRIPSLTITPGGNGSNTAVTCARLGLRTALAGILGDDLFGRHLREWLVTEGVEVSLLELLPGERSPVTVVTNDVRGERSFVYFPGTDDDFLLNEAAFTAPARLVHLAAPELYAGWWPGACLAAVRRLASAGRRVSLDTFVADPATARAEHDPLLPHLELVLPNEEEARALTGQCDPEDMARYFLDRGVKTAAIKLGGQGALIAAAGERHRIPAQAVEVVDTCGAGDSFSGGFIAAWLRGLPLEECGRIGCLLGTRCVTREGSLTGTSDPAFLSDIADRLEKGCRRPILPLND